MELRKVGDSDGLLFLAMAHWQRGKKDEARRWYETAVNRMDKSAPKSETLTRFRAEAAELLGVDPKTPPAPSTAPPHRSRNRRKSDLSACLVSARMRSSSVEAE